MTAGPLAGRTVVVVGAGLAGLAAALECADRGAAVTLFERRNRLGGLTWSFDHNGMSVDNGQHVFLRCCRAYQRFLERIGASSDVVPPAPLDIPVVAPARPGATARVARLRRRDLPVPFHLAGALARYPHMPLKDRLALGRAVVALQRLDLDDPELDRRSFGDWLAAHGQSQAATAALWDLITIPTVNLPAAEASLATAAMVFKTGLLSDRAAADIGWARVPLGRLHGDRAAAALATAGVKVTTGTKVEAVRLTTERERYEVWAGGSPLHCDSVIAALPHEEAARVLPAGTAPDQDRWCELGSSAIVDVHLVFDRPITSWGLMAAVESPVQWVFDRTSSSGLGHSGPGHQYLAVSLSAADHLMGERPETLVTSTVRELGRLLPAVEGARLVDSLVTKERRATFRAGPGSNAVRPPSLTSLPGLALAGAWTATGWPATMEGAVLSGWAAADVCTRAAGPTPTEHLELTQEVA